MIYNELEFIMMNDSLEQLPQGYVVKSPSQEVFKMQQSVMLNNLIQAAFPQKVRRN